MSLISFNAPDHRAQLNAINGNLHEIAENTKKIGYSLDSIREDMHRVADASEVAAGIITKEEIQIKQAIQRIHDNDSIMNGIFVYEEAPAHIQAESETNHLKIEKLYQKLEMIKDERENKLLILSGSEVSLFGKRLKIGRRVAVIAFNINKCRDEIKTGKIVAIKTQMLGLELARPYAVRFDDGKIDLFKAEEIYTEWGEE